MDCPWNRKRWLLSLGSLCGELAVGGCLTAPNIPSGTIHGLVHPYIHVRNASYLCVTGHKLLFFQVHKEMFKTRL